MEKHKFNIFPEMSVDEFEKLVADISAFGYDKSQPIYIYEGAILDGWNRWRACRELKITPAQREFSGSAVEAINFVMRTNKRRNLTKQQLAAIAVQSDEIVEAIQQQIEKERREKQAKALKETHEKGEFGICNNFLLQTPSESQNRENCALSQNYSKTEAEAASSAHDFPEIIPESQKTLGNHAAEQEFKNEPVKTSENRSAEVIEIKPEQSEAAPEVSIAERVIEYDAGYKPKQSPPPKRDPNENAAATQLAKTFSVNRTYINEAKKLKETAPEKLQEVAAGKVTFQQIKKELPPKPVLAPAPDSDMDDFTETVARAARRLHSALNEVKAAAETISGICFRQNIGLRAVAPEIDVLNFNNLINDAQMLKALKKCAACRNRKEEKEQCKWCNKLGYQNKSAYSTTKSALESKK